MDGQVLGLVLEDAVPAPGDERAELLTRQSHSCSQRNDVVMAGLDLETLLVDQRKISFVGHECGESCMQR